MRVPSLKLPIPTFDGVAERLLRTEQGQLFVSVLLGLGLASAFRRVCKGSKCRIVKPVSPDDVEGNIYRVGERCVRYRAVATTVAKA
jgi:hypothetical protein